VNEAEFARRIEIYIERDLPAVVDRAVIAKTLGRQLFQYVKQEPPLDAVTPSPTVERLLPSENVLLFFSAGWDGHSQAYRPVVAEVARRLQTEVVEIDVDDSVGGAIAKLYSVLNVPDCGRRGAHLAPLSEHLRRHPAKDTELVFTSREHKPINRGHFNPHVWHKALEAAGVTPTRETGMHALRHFYASILIDAGESVRAVADYLGHADPGFTLRVYAHLFPSSEERARVAVALALGTEEPIRAGTSRVVGRD
jgi:thiol-disulfide isomerase/thioredoxin